MKFNTHAVRHTITTGLLTLTFALATQVPQAHASTRGPGITMSPTCDGKAITIFAKAGVTTNGTPGNDVIWGTPGDDTINMFGGGNDTVCAGGGNDSVSVWKGTGKVWLGSGDDHLTAWEGTWEGHGGTGADFLYAPYEPGGPLPATVVAFYGDDNDDTLIGAVGNDILVGGAGFDSCNGDMGTDSAATCEIVKNVP